MPGPLVGLAARKLLQSAVKRIAKKKVSSQARLERMLRAENKGDARVTGRIKQLREKESAGLISPRERMNSLNRMTKSYKTMPKKPKGRNK